MCVALFTIKKSLAAVCFANDLILLYAQLVAGVAPPHLSMKIIFPTRFAVPEPTSERWV